MPGTLVIISHENEPLNPPQRHLIHRIRESWQREGWKVVDALGTRTRVPADVAFLHVDLSVVPPEYIELARSYPVAINAGIPDIRKTTYSQGRVMPGDGYAGPVIVKSVMNSAGVPERRLGVAKPFVATEPHGNAINFRDKRDYRVFSSVAAVPPEVFGREDLLVEKFLTEMHDGFYCLREWYFLGDASVNRAEVWREPVINSGNAAPDLAAPTPTEVVELRRRMRIDYGKIDYVMHEGRPFVFDVNKTVGAGLFMSDPITAIATRLATGLKSLV